MMMVWDETVSGALGKTTNDRWAKLALLQSHKWKIPICLEKRFCCFTYTHALTFSPNFYLFSLKTEIKKKNYTDNKKVIIFFKK